MKKIIYYFVFVFCITFTYSYIFACEGSCLKCHPNINFNKPKTHQIIKECINCHIKGCGKKNLSSFALNNENNECGSDCFKCHKIFPNDSFHKKINLCVKCHKKI